MQHYIILMLSLLALFLLGFLIGNNNNEKTSPLIQRAFELCVKANGIPEASNDGVNCVWQIVN